ncbi:MAG: hypothetical protein K8I00_06775 [Candidatus Omnitrophica bacterium]|nr:hypothetical protein [Candidatus Omnitrophota bacterium]
MEKRETRDAHRNPKGSGLKSGTDTNVPDNAQLIGEIGVCPIFNAEDNVSMNQWSRTFLLCALVVQMVLIPGGWSAAAEDAARRKQDLLTRGMEHLKRQEYRQAEALAREVLETIDPESAEAYRIIGLAEDLRPGFRTSDYRHLGGRVESPAEEWQRKRVELLTESRRLLTAGKYKEAHATALEVLQTIDQHDPTARHIECVARLRLSGLKASAADLQKIRECPPYHPIQQ